MAKIHKALLGGSLVLLVTFNIFNVLNFVFQLSMARLLEIAEYGILAVLFSFIYIINFFSDSIQTIIAKYASSEKKDGKLKNILLKSFRKAFKISFILFLAYAAISVFLSNLIKIPYPLMLLNGLMIFVFFFIPITRGVMQGRKKFNSLGISMVIEGAFKLVLAIVLVLIGWKVYGAIAATVLGAAIAFFFTIFSLKGIFKSKETSSFTPGIYQYASPVFFTLLAITLFYSIDIVIAKIVFEAETAGAYAIASILAKTIFIGTQPISRALFSFAAEKKTQDKNMLINAFGIILACIIPALIIFYFFPDFMIRIFSGKNIPVSSSILFYLAIAMSLASLTNLVLLYRLSINKAKNYLLFLLFPLIEAVVLYIFSASLVQFSIALIWTAAIFLWAVIVLFDK